MNNFGYVGITGRRTMEAEEKGNGYILVDCYGNF